MTQTKIEGKFYPLKSEEWLKSIKELSHSELKVLYYLRSLDPYSNGVSLSPTQIARDISTEKVKVHRSTVSRALKSLDRKGFISMELLQVRVKVISQGVLSPDNNVVTTQQCCDHATQVVTTQQAVQPHNTGCPQATQVVPRQQSEAESIDISSFQNPKNIKTYTDYKDSLSDSEREENSVSQNSFPTQESETSNNLVPSSSSSNSLVSDKNLGLDQKRQQNHSLTKSLNSNISNNSSEPRPQTYSDLIGALDESAQEKFLLFAKKKAASLPKPPTLSNRWIEKNFDELYEQWRASEQRLQENLALRTASLTASDQEARREEPSEKMVSLSGDLLRKLKEEVMKNV